MGSINHKLQGTQINQFLLKKSTAILNINGFYLIECTCSKAWISINFISDEFKKKSHPQILGQVKIHGLTYVHGLTDILGTNLTSAKQFLNKNVEISEEDKVSLERHTYFKECWFQA